MLSRADRTFRHHRPDAVVLIDYPGFNWWIARRAKAHGIPVIYYGTPQLWAWASWRVKKMRRFVDHVLCKLPFEPKWFGERGCPATFVGHPYFDELASQRLDESFLRRLGESTVPLVTILPGSRTQEVRSNMGAFIKAARMVAQRVPNVRFAVAAFKSHQAEMIRELIRKSDLPMEVHVGRTPELIHAADCCMACSGSVSLELLYHAKPTVILYQVTRFGYFVQYLLRKVRYITLVNLLTAEDPFADRTAGIYDHDDPRDTHVLMPEYLTYEDKSEPIAEHVVTWLTDRQARNECASQLAQLREQVGQGGASRRAAEYISRILAADPIELPQMDKKREKQGAEAA